jgi:7-cyano-7-deazaguanine synthase in queuosine biosynthesis
MEIVVGNPNLVVNVFIPMGSKKIAVLVSGGADSAILLYILAIESAKYNIDLNIFTIPRADGALEYSRGLVKRISEIVGYELKQPITVGDSSLHHSQQTRSGHRDILKNYPDIDYIYYGSQQVSSDLLNISDVHYPFRPDRMFNFGKAICPFHDLTKEHTLELYYKLEVEDLLKYSHSCCVWEKGRCGKCYNCIEREWAFKKLNKVDPGSL